MSELAPSNQELIGIIYKASSKIRELRELIENLSKKLCISENSENSKFLKLKKTIERLKIENKKLFSEKYDLETQLSPDRKEQVQFYQSLAPKAPSDKTQNFFSKHKLRPSSTKNLKSPVQYTKSSILKPASQSNLKNLKILKQNMKSPHNRNVSGNSHV